MEKRTSIRRFNKEAISAETLDRIVESALRAPTAGNMMLYSIIVIRDKQRLSHLAESCDDQPFIATADAALLFVGDFRRWDRYFRLKGVEAYEEARGGKYSGPDAADFTLAIQDGLIAAQNAVIAAEALGIGSCYIGDIMENFEEHKALFGLPSHTFPLTLLVLGCYDEKPAPRERFDRPYVVFEENYRDLSDKELLACFDRYERMSVPQGYPNKALAFYDRKIASAFHEEMRRSIETMYSAFVHGES
jgi:nitroreductase